MDLSIKEFFGRRVKFSNGHSDDLNMKGKVVAIYHEDYKSGESDFRILGDNGTQYFKSKNDVEIIPVIKLFAYQAAKNQVQWFSVQINKSTATKMKLTRAPKLDKEIEA